MSIFSSIYSLFTNAGRVEPEVLRAYQSKLPDSVEVDLHQDEDRYWAKIALPEQGDVLFTEADDRIHLEESINKAVAAYYEVQSQYVPYLLVSKRYRDPELVLKDTRQPA